MAQPLPKPEASYKRPREDPVKNPKECRDPAERDYDRILYSSAFRRLAGVTQVAGAHESHVLHNRLTHSFQVAQLSRRIAEKIVRTNEPASKELGIDPSVAEAAGLAHDLGHPPFGHIAEKTLDELLIDKGVPDGFEGNPQSFRIACKLALREPGPQSGEQPLGLNLTGATLDAMLKYPWFRNFDDDHKKDKWGAYKSEANEFRHARAGREPEDGQRCPEAEIMDWADDVTYAVHDIEDFYRVGLVPLERLASDTDDSERARFYRDIEETPSLRKRIGGSLTKDHIKSFEEVVTAYPLSERYAGTTWQRVNLRYFASVQIGLYVNAFDFRESNGKFVAFVDEEVRRQIEMLKLLTWHYVIYNPSLATQQYGEREVIRKLFRTFHEAGTDTTGKDVALIPMALRKEIIAAKKQGAEVARLVADLLCGLTERQALDIYHRLCGTRAGSLLDDLSR